MASQGGEAAAGSDAKPSETSSVGQASPSPYPALGAHHSWSSSAGAATVSWNYSVDNSNQNAVYYDPQMDVSVSGGTQTVASSAPHMVQSTVGTTNATHSYAPYSSSVQHSYNGTQYPNYYYSYSQTTNDSSVQQGGADQSSGAAYQPLTSFQNSGSYAGPTSNSYYNSGGHQTVPGYATSNYYYQNNAWNDGSSGNNHAPVYQSYTSPSTNSVQSSSSAPANSFHYHHQYNQWAHYYDQPVPNPGGIPVAGSSASDTRAPTISSGYPYPSSQPPPPGTTSWKSDAGSSVVPPQAPSIPVFQNQYANQAQGITGSQNQYVNQASAVPLIQNQHVSQAPAYPQNTTNYNQLPQNHADQQKTLRSQGPSSNVSLVNHVCENSQTNLQGAATSDTHRVSKIQIPTNPRIAPSFSMAMPKGEEKKIEVESSTKPAYVSVPMPRNDVKATLYGPEAVMQGSFPVSLRTYVQRSLARCKDEALRAVSQSIMKEIITKATADGTLHTKNWDIEPLFPLPENATSTNTSSTPKNSSPFSCLASRRSPSRRVKSRWEPVAEEKVAEKVEVIAKVSANNNIRSSSETTKRMGNSWDLGKFLQSRQAPVSQYGQGPSKKQHIGGNTSLKENGNASSDSDKEQDLTKYYSSAIALANSPEEKKRREHRSKRFERSLDASLKLRSSAPDKDGAANIYRRRAISMLLNKSYEDGAILAVEDLDWDALTVKGTCQEIEKRYLRLTSAPDPTTVRPEDVLEKALHMVQTSQKNYLYKCDQLKSIRQDLTVQRIQNELTVRVYETHARLALQAGDLPEYNQCQSQLKRLYAEGIKGSHLEFSAYNLLCIMLHSNSKRDLLSSMASLSKEAKQDEAVKHALAVRSAVSSGNHVLFFKLYRTAPNLNSCLMDLCVERMRFEAIKCISKSYRPSVPVRYVAQILGFMRIDGEDCDAKGADGLEECEEWLKAHGAVLSVDNNTGELQIDTKTSCTALYMPEPGNAVAHGDASLAVDDFWARA